MRKLILLLITILIGCNSHRPLTNAQTGPSDILPPITPLYSPPPIPTPSPSPISVGCTADWIEPSFTYNIQEPGHILVPPFAHATLRIDSAATFSAVLPLDVIVAPNGTVFRITGSSLSSNMKTRLVTGFFDDPTPSGDYTVQAKIIDSSNHALTCLSDPIHVTRNILTPPPPPLGCTLTGPTFPVNVVVGPAGELLTNQNVTFSVQMTGAPGITAIVQDFGGPNPNFQIDTPNLPVTGPSVSLNLTGHFTTFQPGSYPFTATVRNGPPNAPVIGQCSTSVTLTTTSPSVAIYRHALSAIVNPQGSLQAIDWLFSPSNVPPSGYTASSANPAFHLASSPVGVWTVPFYHCFIAGIRHYISTDLNCENANAVQEGILGYGAETNIGNAFPFYRATRLIQYGAINATTYLSIGLNEFNSGHLGSMYTLDSNPFGRVAP